MEQEKAHSAKAFSRARLLRSDAEAILCIFSNCDVFANRPQATFSCVSLRSLWLLRGNRELSLTKSLWGWKKMLNRDCFVCAADYFCTGPTILQLPKGHKRSHQSSAIVLGSIRALLETKLLTPFNHSFATVKTYRTSLIRRPARSGRYIIKAATRK
jgi:hypothetical protein